MSYVRSDFAGRGKGQRYKSTSREYPLVLISTAQCNAALRRKRSSADSLLERTL